MSKQLNGSVEITALVHVRMEVQGQNGKVMGTFVPDVKNYADVVEKKDQNIGIFIPVVVWINDEENERVKLGQLNSLCLLKFIKEWIRKKQKNLVKTCLTLAI